VGIIFKEWILAVYKRGKSWYIDVRIGGVRIHRKAADTKAEAKRIEEELKTKWRLKQLHVSEIKDEPVLFFFCCNSLSGTLSESKS